jgi:DNA-binding beta-propeller fold protein YncE
MSARFPIFLAGLLLGLAAARADSLYVGTCADIKITEFAPDSRSTAFACGGLDSPEGLAFDNCGNRYAANRFANTIERFDSLDNYPGVFANSGVKCPVGLAFDNRGILDAANDDGDTVGEFDFTGNDLGAPAASGLSGKGPVFPAFGFPGMPEPSTVALLASGAAMILVLRHRK